MTPKEKAEELFKTFALGGWPEVHALNAVNELIRIAPWGGDIDGEIEEDSKEYYIKVKEEIEKL